MMESTVITKDSEDASKAADAAIENAAETPNNGKTDDIMSVLLAHEKKQSNLAASALKGLNNDSDSSSDEMMNEVKEEAGEMENSESDEDDGIVPTVNVGNRVYNITDINDTIIAEMTQAEKEIYVQVFQDYYSHMNY